MDLIGGISIVTAVFLLAAAIVSFRSVSAPGPFDPAQIRTLDLIHDRRTRTAFTTLLIAFFVGLADVLVAAQLPAVAFVNVVIGGAAIAILYNESHRARSDSSDEQWRH
jgi:hypothetical protein